MKPYKQFISENASEQPQTNTMFNESRIDERFGWDQSFKDYNDWQKAILDTWGEEIKFDEIMDGLIQATDSGMVVGGFDMKHNSGQMMKR